MFSIQMLTRNFRRAIPIRRFGSTSVVPEKVNTKLTTTKDAKAVEKPTSTSQIFEKLKSMDDAASDDNAGNTLKKEPTKKSASKSLPPTFTQLINNAETVEKLLELCEQKISQQNAMKIVSKLSNFTASGKANVNEFENDYRFLNVCRRLSKHEKTEAIEERTIVANQKSIELETVLSVAGDEEAIKIIGSYTLSQKVRVLTSLARKKTRSTAVLRSLANSISSATGILNLKECADVLYAMVVLNFIDEVLLSRVTIDINQGLTQNKDKQAVVGSIVTSLGHLKYKEPTLLYNLTKWIASNQELCRPKDLASLMLTLASVNYRTDIVNDLKTKIIPKITRDDLTATEWLDYVWALCVLDLQQSHHLASILQPEFNSVLMQNGKDITPAQKMKILNINAVAKHLTLDYDGPFVQTDSLINNVPFGQRKSKTILINGLLDTLKNLFTTQSYIRTDFDTTMGFTIDAECVLNDKRTPLAVESQHQNAFRIAFFVLDYFDMCRGQSCPNGYAAIAIKLLEKIGYHVLLVPHSEFSTSDKVLKRVQYVDEKLKNIVQQPKK